MKSDLVFSELLYKFRKENQLSQNDLIEFFVKEYVELRGLDVVTISRWERNATTPSLKRRIYIMSIIHKTFEYFSRSIDSVTLSKSNKISLMLKKRFPEIQEQSLNAFLLKNNKLSFNSCTYLDIPETIYNYIYHFEGAELLDLRSENNKIIYLTNANNIIEGFFTFIMTKDITYKELHIKKPIVSFLSSQLAMDSSDKSVFCCLLNLNKNAFDITYLSLYIFLLENDFIDNMYFMVQDKSFVKFAQSLDMEIKFTYQTPMMKNKSIDNTVIFKISRIDFLAKKDIYEYFSYRYKELIKDSPSLINEIRENIINY
ncbi:TPA: helix-turn-helix domain-containing protein [Photobacterium damselae]